MLKREALFEIGSNSHFLDLINIQNIKIGNVVSSGLKTQSVYTIDTVNPLVISNNDIVTVTFLYIYRT